jgi:hypothetical protein
MKSSSFPEIVSLHGSDREPVSCRETRSPGSVQGNPSLGANSVRMATRTVEAHLSSLPIPR